MRVGGGRDGDSEYAKRVRHAAGRATTGGVRSEGTSQGQLVYPLTGQPAGRPKRRRWRAKFCLGQLVDPAGPTSGVEARGFAPLPPSPPAVLLLAPRLETAGRPHRTGRGKGKRRAGRGTPPLPRMGLPPPRWRRRRPGEGGGISPRRTAPSSGRRRGLERERSHGTSTWRPSPQPHRPCGTRHATPKPHPDPVPARGEPRRGRGAGLARPPEARGAVGGTRLRRRRVRARRLTPSTAPRVRAWRATSRCNGVGDGGGRPRKPPGRDGRPSRPPGIPRAPRDEGGNDRVRARPTDRPPAAGNDRGSGEAWRRPERAGRGER